MTRLAGALLMASCFSGQAPEADAGAGTDGDSDTDVDVCDPPGEHMVDGVCVVCLEQHCAAGGCYTLDEARALPWGSELDECLVRCEEGGWRFTQDSHETVTWYYDASGELVGTTLGDDSTQFCDTEWSAIAGVAPDCTPLCREAGECSGLSPC